MKSNIILIGMAGSGKSTVGVLIAKMLGYDFLDTDLIIQKRENKLLQNIIDCDGLDYFKSAEESALLSIIAESTVIATGGSAVYCDAAMKKLKENGVCVWLYLPFSEINRRIMNPKTRGIAISPGMTLEDVYNEREPLYQKYADLRIDCVQGVEENARQIIRLLKNHNFI
jgi:shikimate kinase